MMKYSEYAQERVLADLLEYLLVHEPNKLPFLNNGNVEKMSSELKLLFQGVEIELEEVQNEKERIMRVSGPNYKEVIGSDQKFLNKVLKRNRFKSYILAKQKEKMNMIHELEEDQEPSNDIDPNAILNSPERRLKKQQ